ncbi:MAG: S-layer homology domain-containing protein [Candidatus Altimarinota bacterium]
MAFFSRLFIALGLLFFLSPQSFAQVSGNYFYYVLPPEQTMSVNQQPVLNESTSEGKMIFKKEKEEALTVSKTTTGLRLFSRNYQVHIKSESKLKLTSELALETGSIHVRTNSTPSGSSTIWLGKLKLSFQSADFVAFVSGDGTEKIIKVIEGEVQVEQPEANQKTTVKTQQSTSTDASGKLLIPFAFEVKPDQFWWESKPYQNEYQLLPLAHAGEDQRVLGNIAVVLDGSKSQYKTGDIFEWTLVRGPKDEAGKEVTQVSFDSTNIVKPLFTPLVDGEYIFTLQITDEKGEKSNLDEVIVYVGKKYLRPIAIFPDVPAEHPNNLAITYLYQKNVMKGSEDPETGKILFRPDDTINRVEILKTLFENKRQKIPTAEELQSLETEIFVDVKPEHWFAPYVYLAKTMNIVSGNNGLYRPADKVILVEALKIITQTNQMSLDAYQNTTDKPYPDAEAGAWYAPSLFFVKKYNLVDVDKEGNINPSKALTRAEFAEIIYRMESINLLEKRSYLNGMLRDTKTNAGVSGAEIYIYKAVEEKKEGENGTSGFIQKGDLYYKTVTKSDGSFSVSLPIRTKYYVEAVSGDDVSTNRVVIELEENKSTRIDLEISRD